MTARRRRWGVSGLVGCGVILAVVCGWRLAVNRPQDYREQLAAATVGRPAPDFEALDMHNHMFRLRRYLGRHRVLVVFYEAELTATNDPRMTAIRAAYPQLSARDVQVVGVSTALPQENRAAVAEAGDFPLTLVTDIDLSIHDRWARIDPRERRPLPGVFLVDRKGEVPCFGPTPQPVADLDHMLAELTRE